MSERGLECACGSLTEVRDSRPCPGGIRRRRRCSACGARFTTFEYRHASVDDVVADFGAFSPNVMAQLHGLFDSFPAMAPEDRDALLRLARSLAKPRHDPPRPSYDFGPPIYTPDDLPPEWGQL